MRLERKRGYVCKKLEVSRQCEWRKPDVYYILGASEEYVSNDAMKLREGLRIEHWIFQMDIIFKFYISDFRSMMRIKT